MGKFVDLTGMTFAKLTVVELDYMHKKHGAYWKCRCLCGNQNLVSVSRRNLVNGNVLSCGCLVKEVGRKRIIDLSGKKFGFLLVLEIDHTDSNKGTYWKCQCDCGNLCVSKSSDLKSGKTKSCGCYRAKRIEKGLASFNRLYDTYRRRAKNNDFEFEYTKEEFKEITQMNCFYCGCEPYQKANSRGMNGTYIYNGIDRIDSSKGYTKENTVPCCGFCNVAKNNHSQEEFFVWIKKAYINIYGEYKNV